MSKKEFMSLLDSGAPTTRAPSQKADWDAIIADCKDSQGQEPFTARDFWETYAKGVVTDQRARKKLDQLRVQNKLLRIDYKGTYYYAWTETALAE